MTPTMASANLSRKIFSTARFYRSRSSNELLLVGGVRIFAWDLLLNIVVGPSAVWHRFARRIGR
jgi:hypothetical protein